ncbi:MAG: hypothetical protein H6686_04780 [Fibrobacteria bacterium]|nr:hypothetical protein [Fibrobacteria bacterium]
MLRAVSLLVFFFLVSCGDPSGSGSVRPGGAEGEPLPGGGVPGPDLLDRRDGRTYRTVVVGSQVWMAENLGLDTFDGRWSHSCDARGCAAPGRFYTWPMAMADTSLGNWCDVFASPRGICPAGWHLPDSSEWNTLARALGGVDRAGSRLKSSSGWMPRPDGTSGGGREGVGFDARPAGYWATGDQGYGWYGRTPVDSAFLEAGYRAAFWSGTNRTHFSCTSAWGAFLSNQDDGIRLLSVPRATALSIRCLRDADTTGS